MQRDPQRFMTYTQLEKAYRKVLSRPALRTPGKRQTPYRKIAETLSAEAWPGTIRSDGVQPLRPGM